MWPRVLEQITHWMRADIREILLGGAAKLPLTHLAYCGRPPQSFSDYEDRYQMLDPRLSGLLSLPAGKVVAQQAVIADREFFLSQFYNDFFRLQGVRTSLCLFNGLLPHFLRLRSALTRPSRRLQGRAIAAPGDLSLVRERLRKHGRGLFLDLSLSGERSPRSCCATARRVRAPGPSPAVQTSLSPGDPTHLSGVAALGSVLPDRAMIGHGSADSHGRAVRPGSVAPGWTLCALMLALVEPGCGGDNGTAPTARSAATTLTWSMRSPKTASRVRSGPGSACRRRLENSPARGAAGGVAERPLQWRSTAR